MPTGIESPMREGDGEEQARIIGMLLDRIMPFPHGIPEDVREKIDVDRQMIAVKAGWKTMPLSQLRDLTRNIH